MFELSIAFKYLLPRWRQLSVSLISLISILVIALVVWLIIVFFSVTMGLEKQWVDKLVAITAPVRLVPTEAYYNSYYYQIDSISAGSQYVHKTIAEKLAAPVTDPYNPNSDESPPEHWPTPELSGNAPLDIVKETFNAIGSIKNVAGLSASDYEVAFGTMRLRLLRDHQQSVTVGSSLSALQEKQGSLSQPVYIGSLDPINKRFHASILPLDPDDLSNIFHLISISSQQNLEDYSSHALLAKDSFQDNLTTFLSNVHIDALKTPPQGIALPYGLIRDLSTPLSLEATAVIKDGKVAQILIPETRSDNKKWQAELAASAQEARSVRLVIPPHLATSPSEAITYTLSGDNASHPLPRHLPIILPGNFLMQAEIVTEVASKAKSTSDLMFDVQLKIQDQTVKGTIPYGNLKIGKASHKASNDNLAAAHTSPPWVHKVAEHLLLPADALIGDGVLLPKGFKDVGVFVGDRGYVSYYTPTASALQEQRIPVFVAGFYDPGIIPIGGKFILANKDVTSLIRGAYSPGQESAANESNGIHVHLDKVDQAESVKKHISQSLEDKKLAPYWRVETFREFDFAKDLLLQIQSEKRVFTLISMVIIIVACSNIISMLIILVNDKKKEIGILLAMGATTRSIAFIFGLCGIIIGMLGSLLGMVAAIATLHNLNTLLDIISRLQGYRVFNAHFYGDTLPTTLSGEALFWIILGTACISLLAGLIPAIKASRLRPSAILRAE